MEKVNTEKKVVGILRKNTDSMTITDLVKVSDLSRSTIRVALARLEGARDVNIRIVGMSKLYSLVRKGEDVKR